MSAALAVRLAILKILTSSDLSFLDEPTQNLDEAAATTWRRRSCASRTSSRW